MTYRVSGQTGRSSSARALARVAMMGSTAAAGLMLLDSGVALARATNPANACPAPYQGTMPICVTPNPTSTATPVARVSYLLNGTEGGAFDTATFPQNVSSLNSIEKIDSGIWTLTGTPAPGLSQVFAGPATIGSVEPGTQGTLIFATPALTSEIYVNGATIRAATAGGFGSGRIYALDPRIEFAATGEYSNPITLASTNPQTDPTTLATTAANVTATLTGQVSDFGNNQPLVIDGPGVIALTNDENSWSGRTTVNAGSTLVGTGSTISGTEIVNNGTLVYDQPEFTQTMVAQAISGTGQLVKRGTGSTILSEDNSFTGATTIEAGVLRLESVGALGQSASVAVRGDGVIDTTLLTEPEQPRLTINNVSGEARSQIFVANNGVVLNNTADTVFAGRLVDTASNSDERGTSIIKAGSAQLTLAGANILNGIDVTDGRLVLTGTNSITGVSIDGDFRTDAGRATLALSGGGTLDNARVTVSNGGVFDVAGVTGEQPRINGLQGSGGLVSLGNNTLTLVDADPDAGFDGVISGSGGLTVTGGTQTLQGVNTYTGATIIAQGAGLALDGSYDLETDAFTPGSIAASSGVQVDGTFDISALGQGAATITALTGGTTGRVQLGMADLLITGANGTFAGVIEQGQRWQPLRVMAADNGAGVVITGDQTFTGDNTYTGDTVLDGATLRLGDGGTTGSVSGDIVFAGSDPVRNTLVINRSNELTINNLRGEGENQTGAGNFIQRGTGTTFLGKSVSYNGTTSIEAGTLFLQGTQALAESSAVNVAAGATLDASQALPSFNGFEPGLRVNNLSGAVGSNVFFGSKGLVANNTVDTIFTGTISNFSLDNGPFGGTGVFAKTGDAQLTLAGDNDLRDVVVSGGRLVLTGDNADISATVAGTGATLALAGNGSLADSFVAAREGGTFDVSGVTSGATAIASLSGDLTGRVALGATTLTLTDTIGEFDGVISGTGGLTIAGGTQSLRGLNSYTGVTTINAGSTLALNSYQQFDEGDVLVFAQDGSIATSSNVVVDGTLTIAGLSADTAVRGLSGAATGQVLLGERNLTITNATGAPFAGVISDNVTFEDVETGEPVTRSLGSGVTITGGTQIFTGTNTYTGATTLNGGNLTLGDGGTTGSVAGPIALTNGTLTVNRSDAVTIGQVLSGAGNLVQAGSGTTTLTAANTYTGTTAVNAGTLLITNQTGIATSSATSVAAGGTLAFATGNRAIVQNLSGAGRVTVAGNGGLDIVQNTDTVFSGNLASGGQIGIDKSGTGKLTLTGVNDVTAGVGVNAGTLALAGNGSIASAFGLYLNQAGANFDIAGISGTTASLRQLIGAAGSTVMLGQKTLQVGAGNFAGNVTGAGGVTSTGTLRLSGTNTFTGPLTIASGTTTVAGGSAIGDATNVAIASGATLALAASERIGGLSGTGAVILNANTLTLTTGGTYGGVATGTGGITIASGDQVFTGTNTYTGPTTLNGGNLTLGNGGTTGSVAGPIALTNGTLTINRSNAVALTQVLSGAGNLVQAGSGTTTLTAANTYTGTTTISGGTLALAGDGSIAASAVTNNAIFDISAHNGGTSVASLSGTGATTLGANTLTLTNGTGTYSGALSGTGGLTAAGGTTTLSGVNTYTGATTINSGATLALAGAGSIAASAVTNNGTFSIAGHNGATSVASLSGTGATTLGANTLTLTNGGNYAGVASGTGGLTAAGGTTTLTGANTYTGTTTIDTSATLALAGTGSIAGSQVIANGTFSIASHDGGATVAGLSGTGSVLLGANTLSLASGGTFGGVASGTGGLTVLAGTQVLTGTNAYTGTTTLNGGNLTLGNGSTTGSVAGPVALTNGTLTINRSNAVALTQVLSGAGNLVQAGSGTTTLTAANTYTGTTTISGGTLALAGDGSIAGSAVTNNATFDISAHNGGTSVASLSGTGGTTLGANTLTLTNGTGTYSGALSGTGGLTNAGGTTTLTGRNSFTGPVAVTGGTLAVSGGQAIADTVVVTVAQGATFGVSGAETVANIAGAGTIALAQGANLTFGGNNAASSFGNFTGAGGLTKVGTGTFSLSGTNAASGAFAVNGGTLRLASASYAGPVSIASGAQLAGSGQVGALTLQSGSVLAPGEATGTYGTIRATSLNAAAGSTIRIDFGGNSTGNASDRVIVSGTAAIGGATIDARPTSPTADYTFNQYFALTAGTVTGQFTNATEFTTNPYDTRLRQRIRYDLGGAVLEVRFLQDLTLGLGNASPNAVAAANALNGAQQGANDQFAAFLNPLADATGAVRAAALQQASGEGAINGMTTSFQANNAFLQQLQQHMAQVVERQNAVGAVDAGSTAMIRATGEPGSKLSALAAQAPGSNGAAGEGVQVWGQAYSLNQQLDGAAGGFAATQLQGIGLIAGIEAQSERGAVGVAFGYSQPQTRTPGLLAKNDGDTFSAGVNGLWRAGGLYAAGALAYSRSDFDTTRLVSAGAAVIRPAGSNKADTYGASLRLGYRVPVGARGVLEPFAGADYVRDKQHRYVESIGGAAALTIAPIRSDRLIGTAGLKASTSVEVATVTVTPELRAGAVRTWGDRQLTGLATFAGAPAGTGSFLLRSNALPKEWATVGGSLTLVGRDQPLSLAINYDGAFAKRLDDHRVSIGATLRF